LVAAGIAIMGTVCGLICCRVLPHRLIKPAPWPGLSLVLAPLGAGMVMQVFGSWRRERGGKTSSLATFWGGALFAFCMAYVRWLIVG
jgi:tellurite resistance protein TehA-like permease